MEYSRLPIQIGGILASEMPVDEAGLHAAIIAVNEALDHDGEDNEARALRNPAACLADINQVHQTCLIGTELLLLIRRNFVQIFCT